MRQEGVPWRWLRGVGILANEATDTCAAVSCAAVSRPRQGSAGDTVDPGARKGFPAGPKDGYDQRASTPGRGRGKPRPLPRCFPGGYALSFSKLRGRVHDSARRSAPRVDAWRETATANSKGRPRSMNCLRNLSASRSSRWCCPCMSSYRTGRSGMCELPRTHPPGELTVPWVVAYPPDRFCRKPARQRSGPKASYWMPLAGTLLDQGAADRLHEHPRAAEVVLGARGQLDRCDPLDRGPDFLCIVPLDERIDRGLRPTGRRPVTTTPTLAYFIQSRIRGSRSLTARESSKGIGSRARQHNGDGGTMGPVGVGIARHRPGRQHSCLPVGLVQPGRSLPGPLQSCRHIVRGQVHGLPANRR